MKNSKTENSYKKIVLFLILPLLSLSLVVVLVSSMINVYQQPDIKELVLEPEKIININEPFAGDLYFNDELGHKDFSALIINGLDGAKKRVELAMYSADNYDILNAIYRAADRGVKVDLIFSTKHEAAEKNMFSRQHKNLSLKFIGGDEYEHMHHKFLIIDRGETQSTIYFSSYNFTYIQEMFDPSFMLKSNKSELVDLFGEEFDRLSSPETLAFKRTKAYNPYVAKINYTDGYLEVWFTPSAPEISIKKRMMELISGAGSNIKGLIWFLTDKDIAYALLTKAKEIPVSIIVDDFNFNVEWSSLPIMSAQKNRQKINNLEIITDSKRNLEVIETSKDVNLNSFLHQHSLIVDDKIVLFGTNNWSSGGFYGNDESIMVSNIPRVVDAFRASFFHNYNANK